MTEQLYRRRAGTPVKVWRVGDGEPPEWAEQIYHPHRRRWCRIVDLEGGYVRQSGYVGIYMTADEFAHYEPLPAPAPDAEELARRIWGYFKGGPDAMQWFDNHKALGGPAHIIDLCSKAMAPAPDAREALEIAKAALRRISDACPATCDMTVAHGMAAVADEALARIGGGWTPTHRHYKGGLYRELRRGLLEADLTPVVIYESEDGRVWVRPMADFEAKMPDGSPRFARIGGGA